MIGEVLSGQLIDEQAVLAAGAAMMRHFNELAGGAHAAALSAGETVPDTVHLVEEIAPSSTAPAYATGEFERPVMEEPGLAPPQHSSRSLRLRPAVPSETHSAAPGGQRATRPGRSGGRVRRGHAGFRETLAAEGRTARPYSDEMAPGPLKRGLGGDMTWWD